jgi:hypothetical protein
MAVALISIPCHPLHPKYLEAVLFNVPAATRLILPFAPNFILQLVRLNGVLTVNTASIKISALVISEKINVLVDVGVEKVYCGEKCSNWEQSVGWTIELQDSCAVIIKFGLKNRKVANTKAFRINLRFAVCIENNCLVNNLTNLEKP